MMLKQVIDLFEILDTPTVNGYVVEKYFRELTLIEDICVTRVTGEKGSTDFVRITIPGSNGKSTGGTAPTIGIVGRLGGLGARPEMIGFVSDGDGALAALAAGLKLSIMHKNGDVLEGDVIVSTHICPDAPTQPHEPVPFMGSPIKVQDANDTEIDGKMDCILSIDTTKGNYVISKKGIAISPTVKEGYILKTSNDLMNILMRVTGKLPNIFALTQQDITPYGNGLYHLNSILQPAVATNVPVVGVAITTATPVAGCATGATHIVDVELAARFAVETAKDFTAGKCAFYDKEEYKTIVDLYGKMNKYQTKGNM
jgi:hypothetical protein